LFRASINAIQKKTNYLNDNSNGHQVNVPDHSGTLNQIKDGIQNFRLEITQMLNNSKVSYALQIIIMHTFGNLETFFILESNPLSRSTELFDIFLFYCASLDSDYSICSIFYLQVNLRQKKIYLFLVILIICDLLFKKSL